MNKDFPPDRFDFSNLVKYIRTREELPNVITDMETGIEFYNADKVPRDMLTLM